MIMEKYEPIDYTKWNFDGKGNNIINSLSPIEQKIWNIALPFQDKRGDTGHAENVAYFTLMLTDILKGKREITIPAVILHDTGWSQLKENELNQFYGSLGTELEQQLRYRHQEEGVKFSEKLLTDLEYPSEFIDPILEIISEHDTRKGFISKEDGIVRDADKLWRFTFTHWKDIILGNVGMSLSEGYKTTIAYFSKDGFFYSETSKQIARIEFDKAIETYFNEKSL